MAGAALAVEVNDAELRALNTRVNRMLSRVQNPADAMDHIAGMLESQTKGRIEDEKKAPDGTPWAEWSPDYAATRILGVHSKLIAKKKPGLFDDIAHESDAFKAEVFASLEYALTHQLGDDSRGIPARPYMGLSRENTADIEQTMAEWIEGQL